MQYGLVAELLGGVVVGSSRDLSATFYNPGALALTTPTVDYFFRSIFRRRDSENASKARVLVAEAERLGVVPTAR